MIDTHTTNTLEFPKVIDLVRGRCLTPYGKEEVDKIKPMFHKESIDLRLDEVAQMKDIIEFGTHFPLFRIEDDCREALKRSEVEGIFIDPEDILLIGELVQMSIELNGYQKDERDNFPDIAEYLQKMRAFPELRQEISRTIDEDGNVRDNASRKLHQIRLELNRTRQKIIAMLEKVLAGQKQQAGRLDDVITERNGRYVIPVPSSQYKTDLGILHDRSQSGQTLFVEPAGSVESNNKINMLMQDERFELDRILRALTKEIATRAEALIENTRLIGTLDTIHASAVFGQLIGGNRPKIDKEPLLDLKNAKHPLLIVQFRTPEKVVPNSIKLTEESPAVLVTGPNTGGKTILLKTVGLSVMMVQSGLLIAADPDSTVGIFKNVFADIGDEQSIELSLSTFSSHIKNIINGIQQADRDVLLLYDEIGAGTDPKEGSALAESIILHVLEKRARIIATTHYSQLKTLAMDYPDIENASLEFDRKTLAPTYRLNLGLPGSSYAVEIAGRLGMPDEICTRASEIVGSGERSLTELISTLEAELSDVKKDKVTLNERLTKAEEFETLYRTRAEKLKNEVEAEKKKALADTDQFLDDTRREIEKLVAEIRSTGASDEAVKKFHHAQKERSKKLSSMRQKDDKKFDPTVFAPGDSVRIISFNQTGEIETLIGKEKAKVKVGAVTTTVQLRDLEKLSGRKEQNQAKPARPTAGYKVAQVESPEIHLRGMTVDEAMENLEQFLDRAIVAGLHQVYVIHGKGAGILRRTLTQYLKGHRDVESVRLGNWNEGGAGVTIVKLKH